MFRYGIGFIAACFVLCGTVSGQEIKRGQLKKLDVEGRVLVVTFEGRDLEFKLTDNTRVLEATGKTLAERLSGFKPGAEIFFKANTRDGKSELEGIKLAGNDPQRPAGGTGKASSPEHQHLKPLPELGREKYQGFEGGFYPDGQNARPASHEAAGLKLAQQIQPLDVNGKPDSQGKIVLMSVGMSNTSQSSEGFQQALRAARDVHSRFSFVNGAQGGMTAAAIQDPNDNNRGTRYWSVVDDRLKQAGSSREQVQIIWIKQADAGPSQGFPRYAQTLQAELARIVQIFPSRFPNAKLVYLTSRTYGGFATTSLNPEPYAYESGFAVKWLIEQQIQGDAALNFDPDKGAVKAPWLSWGPYFWANGATKRADGFAYDKNDFSGDGTHQSPTGQRKVGGLMLDFFETDATTRPWFVQK